MPVEVKKPEHDLRTLEMAILRESAGCSYENAKVQTFNYGMLDGVVLHLNALAKKLLGIYGVAIGNDPRRAQRMSGVSYRDWDAERAQIDRSDNPWREQQLKELQFDKERADRLAAEFDGAAWEAVSELEEVLKRRAMALARTVPPLLEFAQDDLPNEVVFQEKQLGGKLNMPNESMVQITRDGLRFLATGKALKPKPNQHSPSRMDDDLEIEGGWDL